MRKQIPKDWQEVLQAELDKPYWSTLKTFLSEERKEFTVFPSQEDVFNALEYTPYEQTKVLILGQDPYFNDGEAHGLAFSVQPGIKVPPSLVNIYKELESDLGIPRAKTGYLKHWAEQGVLLLNTALTVRKGEANSHKGKGWEKFTDAVIQAVNEKKTPVVFMLWGANAQKKLEFIDTTCHTVVKSVHPSPLAARGGFFGSKPFSKINAALVASGQTPIDWNVT